MSNFQLNDDDVLSMNRDHSLHNTSLIKTRWFRTGLERLNAHLKIWLGEGVECEILSVNGGGWQKGKVYLRMEFIPDEPPSPEPSNPEQTDAVLSPSPEQ